RTIDRPKCGQCPSCPPAPRSFSRTSKNDIGPALFRSYPKRGKRAIAVGRVNHKSPRPKNLRTSASSARPILTNSAITPGLSPFRNHQTPPSYPHTHTKRDTEIQNQPKKKKTKKQTNDAGIR